MKRFLLLLLFLAFPLLSQTPLPIAPDCTIGPTILTAAARYPTTGYSNTQGCVYWVLWYKSTGFTVIAMELDSAPDSSGSAGSWVAFNGTAQVGSNSMTSTAGAYVILTAATSGYVPWVSINLGTATGTGTVTAGAYGYKGDVFFSSGGGGGGGTTPIISACTSQASVALSGTGYTQIVAGSGTKEIYVCNIAYSSVASNVPVVNTFSVAFGTCASTPTQELLLGGITGYTDNFFGSLVGTAGGALCASESVSESDIVYVSYLQQ